MRCLRLPAVRRILQITVPGVILLSCVSCASLEPVPRTEANAQQLIGQDIRVTRTDGSILEFRLLEVTEYALLGETQQVLFADVALLQRRGRDFNLLKNGCFQVGAGAALVLLLLDMQSGG